MSANVIIENAITQLEAQKKKVYDDAKTEKLAELKADRDKFEAEQRQKYNEAVAALKLALDNELAERFQEDEDKAKSYADIKAAKLDRAIESMRAVKNDMGA